MVNELLVAADLARQGYEVYRALAGSAPFDLIAYKDEKCYRVEVTTGRQMRDHVSYPTDKMRRYRHRDFDMLAVVCGLSSINYIER